MQDQLPNIVIAGTVKAGTTSLFSYLTKHPDICGSLIKETCYFLPLRYGEALEPLAKYRSYFKCGQERYVLEATPGYFEGGALIAQELKSILGDPRVIIILRDPVDRFISFFHYQKAQVNLPKDLTVNEYIRQCRSMPVEERKKRANDPYWGLDGGFYSEYLEQWFDILGRQNVRIVFFDDLTADPLPVMRDLCKWLDIDTRVYDSSEFAVENRTVPYRFAALHRAAISVNTRMEEFFRRHSGLKTIFRNIYYKINATATSRELSQELEKELRQLYAGSNRKIEILLTKYGYQDLPLWLTGM